VRKIASLSEDLLIGIKRPGDAFGAAPKGINMRIIVSLALIGSATALAACSGEGDGSSNLPAAAAPTPVQVMMHDPGCHSFLIGRSFKRQQSVKGPASFTNHDEAALNVYGPSGYRVVPVGQSATLDRGDYTVTMVGQARDDNVLHLRVQ